MKPNRKLPRSIRFKIQDAMESAQMQRCSVDEATKNRMRVYLDSWVVSPLREVLRWDDGERGA